MIDWDLAQRVASMVSGAAPAESGAVTPAQLARVGSESERLVVSYTQLDPAAALPAPEMVDRREWTAANLESMRPMLDPLSEKVATGLGPLAGPVRAGSGLLIAAQVGALAGYMSQRVLGQYEMAMLDPDAPTRLLFVAPNLAQTAHQLGADPDDLLTWVGFHEVTHAVQFAGVPWLRSHMRDLVAELLETMQVNVDPMSLLKLPGPDDLRALVGALRDGDFVTFMAGPQRRELIDRLQATMAMIEGHAEHVMDAVGADALPSLAALRGALDRRRRTRPPLLRLLERLTGLEMKMRQYELGKRFCDSVVAEDGVAGLNRAWAAPEALPTLTELERPDRWRERVGAAAVAL